MARSILDVIIKMKKEGGADKETIASLVKLKSTIRDITPVVNAFAVTAVAAGYAIKTALDATVGSAVAYADQVRSISQLSGLSAEESSKLIQVTDDLKISFEDLQKVMQKNGDQYDFSAQGLAAMSDQYLALGSSQEKAAFMQERFGKSWGNFVELMEQGSSKIIAAGEGINDALILDQAALDSAREYEKHIDEMSDNWMAFKVNIGNQVLPVLNSLFEYNERYNQSVKNLGLSQAEAAQSSAQYAIKLEMEKIRLQEVDAARWTGLASLYETQTATSDLAKTSEEVAEAMKAMNDANREFLSTLGSVQSAEESYQKTSKSLTEERMSLEEEKQKLLAQGWWEESEKIQDINAKLEENSQKAQENADEYELANKRIMLGLLERKLTADGVLDDKEMQWLLDKGVAWGVYSQKVVDETARAVNEANALIAGIITEKTFTMTLETHYYTYGDDSTYSAGMIGAAHATGTKGWETVPAGFPNDSYPVWLTSGENYAVIPAGGNGANVGVSPATGGGGINVTVNIHSPINTASREETKKVMTPVVEEIYRNMQTKGVVR